MLSHECLNELETAWFPNMTDAGLERVIRLLETGSPLLIHGSFTRAIPMGCLATHIAWNHPNTAHLTMDAGICWLNHVAGLNPATSHVIREWDRASSCNYQTRAELLRLFQAQREQRRAAAQTPHRRFEAPAEALVD
jgi:hypothetical protein